MISVGMIKDVWQFRGFIWGSVKRDFQSRFVGSQLGSLWVVAQPLALITIYTLIFAQIMKPSFPGHTHKFAYSIYLCSGILCWSMFAEMLSRTVNIFVEHAGLLKKVSFPKLCLPLIVITTSWINFLVIFSVLMAFLLALGAFPGMTLVNLIPLILLQTAFTTGVGIFLATLNVFYRDVSETVSIVLQFWFWLTPIVYPATIIPESVRTILNLNPLWSIVDGYHSIILDSSAPNWSSLIYPLVFSITFIWLGLMAFSRLQGEIVDEL